jgi:hypothetical protein
VGPWKDNVTERNTPAIVWKDSCHPYIWRVFGNNGNLIRKDSHLKLDPVELVKVKDKKKFY